MTLTFSELESIVSELRLLIIGKTIREIKQVERESIILKGSGFTIFICAKEGFSRIHLVKEKIKTMPPSPFVMKLRKEIEGGRVQELKILYNDRVVCFDILKHGTLFHLLFECSGHHPNIFLLDEKKTIISMLRKSKSFKRELEIGKIYQKPIPLKDVNINVMRFLKKDISLSEQIEEYYKKEEKEYERKIIFQKLKRFLKNSIEHERNKMEKILQDLKRTERAEEFRKMGEIIIANLKNIKKGDEKFISEGQEISLDIAKNPLENAKKYFEKYKRLKKAIPFIENRKKETLENIERMKNYIEKLNENLEDSEIYKIENELKKYGYEKERERKKGKKERKCYFEFSANDGSKILVGKSAKDNEILTWRIARGKDLFFHAMNFAGAHVILLNKEGKLPSSSAIEDAAILAAFYSEGRRNKSVDVCYTECKYLRKPKGAKTGSVNILRSSTINVNLHNEKIKSLLEKRKIE